MDTFKKSDISKRILETRKQTEELKAQLQNLIDSGINSSLEYKNTLHSHLDKENIKESENKVQIIKSYDTKHSQHITKPSSSRINLPETLKNIKLENQQKNSKKARNYDVNEARDYIKKQKEKRLEQQKLQNEEKKKAEIKKQKLQELHKKSLELVAKNVQVKRERSKSRERIDFVRPVKDIPRSRSSSQEKGINRHKPDLNDNYGRRGKSVERSRNMPLENVGPINPNLLYPPIPTHLLKIQEQKTRTTNKKSPASHNKIVILSGNSTDKKTESPNSDVKNETELLKPKNLFNCSKNTNTLYPPSQSYELNAQMQVTNSNKSPNPDLKNETELLKPKNVSNISKNADTSYLPPKNTELSTRIQISNSSKDEEKIDIANKNSSNSLHKTAISSNNSAAGKTKSRKLDYNTKQKILSPKDVEVTHLTNGKSPLEIESNNNFTSVNNILDYKSTHNKNSSNINLHFPDNVNLMTRNHNNSAKPDGTSKSETVIDAHNLEKFTKETQTNDEPKHEFPSWLQEKKFESNPLNFINTVKRKLHYAINSPKTHVDVGVQSSIAQQNFKPDTQNIKSKEEILDILQHSAKSSRRSDLKSFISHKCLNLDKKTIDNIELIPKKYSSRHLISSKDTETESESDTSKNIPEISSESGTSLNKNAESVKQNGSVGLDVERLTSLKLRAHNVDKDTHTIQSEEIQTEAAAHPYSIVINDKSPIKIDFDDAVNAKTETKRSVSKIHENDQYPSDFQSSSRSISTHSSLIQNKTSINSSKSAGYQNLMDPQVMLYSENHSNNIPKNSERHSNNTTTNIKTNSEKFVSSRNITLRNNSLGKNISHTSIQSNNSRDISTNKKTISNDTSIVTETEAETQGNKNKSEKSQPSEPITSIGSSKKSDEYKSLYSDFDPSVTVNEMLSKSDSNLQYINTRRGSHLSSENSKFMNILPLKEPTLSLVVANEKITQKANKNEDRGKLFKNIPLKSTTNKFADQNNTNEIHLKFEAEIHLLNDFNESLRQFSEVEKAFNSLKSKNDTSGAANKILHNQDTQTSIITKSSSTTSKATENTDSDKSQLSSINFSRFLINADSSSLNDTAVSKLDETNNAEDVLNININQDLCNFENLQSHNFAGMTLRMFEQLIKDEDVRLENLKTILKIREQALLDRTKGELAWLEIQRKHLRETGKLHEASLIKKKQRGILVNHQKERHEMQRLKQMQKAASIERKIILKEQRNLIKNQLSTDKMLSKIKVNTPRERRLSGPLKVIQSHTESIRSETSFSRRSSSEKEKETYSVMSHTQSIVSMVSEVSGEEVTQKDGTSRADSTDLVMKLPSEAGGVPISQMKRTLLIREVALQKRRKAALELLQWHRKLLEEEKRITELESTANTIISQIPNNAPASPDATEKYQFRGKQLNQLWFNLTGCREKKFSENKIYPMSQIALERFCKSAREYSSKAKASKRVSDSEVSEYSVMRTDDSLSENIPDRKVTHSASIRTESELSRQSSNKNESVPVTTANDYTSDFDIESLQDIVNIEDVDVVDKSINQLIDNFNKIQDDISSLSIKQSLKSDIDLEPDESIRSEKTDSEVEISVIETAKTSKERSFEEADSKLVENNKLVNSSQTLSTSEDINDSYKNLADIKTANERSKSTEDKIGTEMPDLVSSSEMPSAEENKDAKLELDQSNNKSTYDKVSSIIEENALNIEGKNNLNTSKEILDELSYLESQINEDLPPGTLEDIEIICKAKDNLSKTEEILSRLSQSEPKHSIISSREDRYPLESEKVSLDKNSATESEGVLLNLRPLDNKVSDDVPSASVLSKRDTELSEDERSVSDTSENLLSKKTPVTEDNIVEITESKDEHVVLNEEKIDLSSEIKSETPIPTEGSSGTRDTSVKSSGRAVDEISESQKILSVIQDEFVISDENQNKEYEDKSKSVCGSNNLQLEQSKSEEVSKLSQEDQDITSEKEKESLHSLPIEEIFEVVEERTDVNERLLTDNNTESDSYTKPLEEDVTEIKDEISDKDETSNSFKNIESYKENVTQEKVVLLSNKETEIITEASEKDLEENIESKSSDTKILLEKSLIEPQSEKHTEEENAEDVVSQQTVPDIIPSVIEETDKSQVTSVPENLATLLSKEDINSFEEKELDSLSSSTTGSQSSMLSEREESQFSEKSKTSSSDEKSPRSGTVDVKKRVSEIMADANQGSRGDKSPKLQDFYTTTYDLVSPANSPELGSPTEEHKYITAKSIFGTEAEELLRKQLAIEQEIKQITEQQQKEQLPYLFVREIPNKPPPPYTPPTSVPAANVITIIPTSDEIENITKYSAKILHKAYLSKNLDNISISENTLSLISKDITKECYKFVFDLCKEMSKEHYKQFEKEECLAWLQVKKNPRLAVVKPLDVTGLEKHMSKKLKELFGYEKPVRRENTIIKWSRKKRDHVDEILVMESQAEETQWTNYDKDELLVMNEVTNEIMNMLLKETGEVFSKILSKQTF